jgi:transposase
VFVDESGTTTAMTRLYARAPAGERVREGVPQAHWKVKTVAGAMRCDGVTAALAFDGATDAAAFLSFTRDVLCPTLRPGDVVILDNLRPHKAAGVREAVEARGAGLMYLPPYSPDYSPVEPMWSKVKQHLRSAKARTDAGLLGAIGDALRSVTAADARGFFEHCGHVVH